MARLLLQYLPSSNAPTTWRFVSFVLVWCLLVLGTAPTVQAQVRGLSYTIAPSLERVYWKDNAGLDTDLLYGGQLGLGFGQYIELNGLYYRGANISTDFGNFSGIEDVYRDGLESIDISGVNLQRYGGELKLNLPIGMWVPFVTAGTGILRFDPEGRDASEQIYLAAGAGLQFSLADRYTLTVQAENLSYRYSAGSTFFNPEELEEIGLDPENFNRIQVSNWAIRAGLGIYLGGRDPDAMTEVDEALREQFAGGLQGITIPVEPFVGQVNFNEAFGFQSSHRVAGLSAGLDLGPYIGARGFYWQDVEPGLFSGDSNLRSYGGELKLNLGGRTLQSINPFVTLGGGYLDITSDYQAREGETVDDEPYATGGVGIVLPVGERLRLNGSARALLMSNENQNDITQPSDVKASYMYSAGVTFTLGGDRPEGVGSMLDESPEIRQLRADLQDTEARLDSLQTLLAARDTITVRTQDTVTVRRPADQPDQVMTAETDEPAEPQRTQERAAPREDADRDPQLVTLPLPEEGELYVRFGRPGGVAIESYYGGQAAAQLVQTQGQARAQGAADTTQATFTAPPLTAEQIRQIVQETVRSELQQQQATPQFGPTSEAQVSAQELEQRLSEQISNMERRLQQRIEEEAEVLRDEADEAAAAEQRQPVAVHVDDDPAEVDDPAVEDEPVTVQTVGATGSYLSAEGWQPYTGFSIGEGPNQFLLGARGIYTTRYTGPVQFRPGLTIGFGQGETSINPSISGILPVRLQSTQPIVPYIGAGVGLMTYDELATVDATFDLALGAGRPFGPGEVYAEYYTMNLFDTNRILLGYRFRF